MKNFILIMMLNFFINLIIIYRFHLFKHYTQNRIKVALISAFNAFFATVSGFYMGANPIVIIIFNLIITYYVHMKGKDALNKYNQGKNPQND